MLVEWNHTNLARFLCVLKVSNNSCCLLIESFCFAWFFERRSANLDSWVNEKLIVQKMHLFL